MDSCNVELCVNKRNGSKQIFSQSAGGNKTTSDLKILMNSLLKLQTEVNTELTILVENEKACLNSDDKNSHEMESEDELIDDDDDDEANLEPKDKKVKR